ncbi:MAG: PEPxxWA-CTERM sorting domain-containing protein [Sphingomicrobium sp.]
MKKMLYYCAGALALVTIPAAASATTLLDETNFSATNLAVTLTFTAGSTSTTVGIGGYQIPSWSSVDDIYLVVTGDSPTTNLLGANFDFTAAAGDCSIAWVGPPGAYGTEGLRFGGTCEGVYDIFSQAISTTVDISYTLGFIVSNPNIGDIPSNIIPSGLRVTASDATVAGVPEPSTWALMLVGFGAIGFVMRFRRRATVEVPATGPTR